MKFNFDSIPKFCISLARCRERRELVQKEFDRHQLQVPFFDAIDKRDLTLPELSIKRQQEPNANNLEGILACMLSHLKLMRMADKMRLPAICVFEDDILLCDDFRDRIRYIESLPGLHFDFFSLGGHYSSPVDGTMQGAADKTQWRHVFRSYAHGGTYGYIITRKAYQFVLRNCTYNYGIDQFYGDVLLRRFNSFAFVPFLVGCRPCVSEITGVHFHYENTNWFYQQTAFDMKTERDYFKK